MNELTKEDSRVGCAHWISNLQLAGDRSRRTESWFK